MTNRKRTDCGSLLMAIISVIYVRGYLSPLGDNASQWCSEVHCARKLVGLRLIWIRMRGGDVSELRRWHDYCRSQLGCSRGGKNIAEGL